MYYVYGDESVAGDFVVYGIVALPEDKVQEIEDVLRAMKSQYHVHPDAKWHCRQIFNPQGRKQTPWSHLSDSECYQMAVDLTTALGQGQILKTVVGYLSTNALGKAIPAIGDIPSFTLEEKKQLIPFAFQAAIAQFSLDPQYKNNMKLWTDPDGTMIKWGGGNRQAGRLLSVREISLPLADTSFTITPENVKSKERPRLLEVADLMTYSCARALAKQERVYDDVFETLVGMMRPVQHEFKWIV